MDIAELKTESLKDLPKTVPLSWDYNNFCVGVSDPVSDIKITKHPDSNYRGKFPIGSNFIRFGRSISYLVGKMKKKKCAFKIYLEREPKNVKSLFFKQVFRNLFRVIFLDEIQKFTQSPN